MTYVALGWLALPHACRQRGGLVPDGLGLTVFRPDALESRLSVLPPVPPLADCWLAGVRLLAGLFGWSRPVYVHTEVTVDDEGNDVTVYDDNCDAAIDDTYYDDGGDGGGSSNSRGDSDEQRAAISIGCQRSQRSRQMFRPT